jgi:hypothetical protein
MEIAGRTVFIQRIEDQDYYFVIPKGKFCEDPSMTEQQKRLQQMETYITAKEAEESLPPCSHCQALWHAEEFIEHADYYFVLRQHKEDCELIHPKPAGNYL